ncbi:MAG: replication-associated recombination protein A [SAR202 cluster bacterium]|nr:replication-associated recombination protein A [SAR202 cluster bacterium]
MSNGSKGRASRSRDGSLFEHQEKELLRREAPLAARMRPRGFDGFVGQEHLIGPGRVLRKAIEADQVPSMVLWGPPGTGKTTLALLIAGLTRSHFTPVSAVASGVADLRKAVDEARDRLGQTGQRTILFVDEIHRFNKAQQDVILPHVENGTVILIGATTENPSFEVVSPLLSRCRVFTLQPLTDEHIESILRRAMADKEHGLGTLSADVEPEAMKALVTLSSGDARVALNALEIAAATTVPDAQGVRRVTVATVEEAMQRRSPRYDRAGDIHYDTISAFIKCVRGSDPDAAVYWLARMIESGEDPLFIARRLVILAAEDIGLAAPQALTVAVAAMQAVHLVGLPEGRIPLAEATIYLATAPKSNSAYVAIGAAMKDVQDTRNDPVPLHLRNAVTRLMKEMGYGEGYKYSHDYEGHFAPMDNLPGALKGRRYYKPSDQGAERDAAERLRKWWGEAKDKPKPDKP